MVFGNEGDGVSPAVIENADLCAVIPMDGCVESFNISVAAAMVLYEARRHRNEHLGAHGDLSPQEQRILLATYYLRQQVGLESIGDGAGCVCVFVFRIRLWTLCRIS